MPDFGLRSSTSGTGVFERANCHYTYPGFPNAPIHLLKHSGKLYARLLGDVVPFALAQV